ncbi:hypothetical protein ACIBBD_37080 [Streptomyces sp. NPDC051315]
MGGPDASIGEVLIGLLLIGGAGVVLPALVVLPAIALGIWLRHTVRHRRR